MGPQGLRKAAQGLRKALAQESAQGGVRKTLRKAPAQGLTQGSAQSPRKAYAQCPAQSLRRPCAKLWRNVAQRSTLHFILHNIVYIC